MSDRCESCGREDATSAVRRIYFAAAVEGDVARAPDGPAEDGDVIDAGIEQWCASCQATYPHTPV